MTLRVFNIDCMFVRHDVKLSIFILFFYFWMGFLSVGFLTIQLNMEYLNTVRRYHNNQVFSLYLSV